MLFISGFKCIIICVHMHACIHVCVHACMGVWTFSSLYMRSYVCVHACVYVHFAIHPPPPKVLMLASLGMPPPHDIEKLPTPMIYIGHVQNGAIFCCNAWTTQRLWGGGGGRGGGGIWVAFLTCHICFV